MRGAHAMVDVTLTLASIPDLYGGELRWTQPLASAIQEHLERYDYEPVQIPTDQFEGKLLLAGGGLPDALPVQIVHQHPGAYLEWSGLARKGITLQGSMSLPAPDCSAHRPR